MVYTAPAVSPVEQAPQSPLSFRPAHRRTRSAGHPILPSGALATSAGPSLATLPRRKSGTRTFFLDDSPEEQDEPERPTFSSAFAHAHLRIDTTPLAVASPNANALRVPFPRVTASGPPSPSPSSPRPRIQRTPSNPVILSNGKPLKPSLKSAHPPDIPDELMPNHPKFHLRARSEPASPSVKSVHFAAEDEQLKSVKVYNRTGRPANLLTKTGEETETETEAEFPFPVMSPAAAPSIPLSFEIEDAQTGRTSVIPQSEPESYANVYLEGITFPKTHPLAIRGTVLVRNVAFEKHVAVRFTLDDWQTTSEVLAHHVVSLPGLPPPFPGRARTAGDALHEMTNSASDGAPQWDRFSFQIRLEDYEHKLADRTLWMVVRYTAVGTGEWWDNNKGGNYRVGFKKVSGAPASQIQSQQRSFTAPSTLRSTPMSGSQSANGAVGPSPLSSSSRPTSPPVAAPPSFPMPPSGPVLRPSSVTFGDAPPTSFISSTTPASSPPAAVPFPSAYPSPPNSAHPSPERAHSPLPEHPASQPRQPVESLPARFIRPMPMLRSNSSPPVYQPPVPIPGSKLSLRNYAAPKVSFTPATAQADEKTWSPISPVPSHADLAAHLRKVIVGGQPASMTPTGRRDSFESETPPMTMSPSSSRSTSFDSIAESASSSGSSSKTATPRTVALATLSVQQRPTSPRISPNISPNSSFTHLGIMAQNSGGRRSPQLQLSQMPRGRVDSSDPTYAAFVKQWCFAQSPVPSPTVVAAVEEKELKSSPVQEKNSWLGLGSGTYGIASWEAGRA